MNFLKRELAPLTDAAWALIEDEARRALKAALSDRKVVDVTSPRGFDFSAVNLGTVTTSSEVAGGVHYGLRRVLPLVEARVPIELDIWDLDNLERGAADVNTEAVTDAALKLSAFEERAVYLGFEPAAIVGMSRASDDDSLEGGSLEIGEDAAHYIGVVSKALVTLNDRGVAGPFALVLGSKAYSLLSSGEESYPPRQQILKLLDGPILHSPVLQGGFVVSLRGGDFELTLGQDISVGYDWHDKNKVHLFMTESFAFRVLGPEAVVALKFAGGI